MIMNNDAINFLNVHIIIIIYLYYYLKISYGLILTYFIDYIDYH